MTNESQDVHYEILLSALKSKTKLDMYISLIWPLASLIWLLAFMAYGFFESCLFGGVFYYTLALWYSVFVGGIGFLCCYFFGSKWVFVMADWIENRIRCFI